MSSAFYIAATGLESGQRALEIVANNIANLNTVGFKRSQVRFSELVSRPAAAAEGTAPAGDPTEALGGVTVSGSNRVFSQGELRTTGSDSDIAITGEGFIELMGPGGKTYLWRGGRLTVDADGFLAADNGMVLKARIAAPAGASVRIAPDGAVTARIEGEPQATVLGQIDIALPRDASAVDPVGDAMFEARPEARLMQVRPGEEGGGSLLQGSLEGSNVQLTDEMVTMLMIQRAYSANAQLIQASDQLMAIANDLRR